MSLLYWFTYLRYTITAVSAIVIITSVIFTRQPSLISNAFGLVAVLPITFLLFRLPNNKKRQLQTILILTIGSIVITILSIASQNLLALHNNYPNPTLVIPLVWCATALLTIIEPNGQCNKMLSDLWKQRIISLSFCLIPMTTILWVLFSQFVVYQAQSLSNNSQWCIKETDQSRTQPTFWISPRKMLLENTYKGTKLPYLLLAPDGKIFDHHWSFKSMNFVKNETNAFLFSLSFYKSKQLRPPC